MSFSANQFSNLSSRQLSHQIASLLIYRSVFENKIGQIFIALLHSLYQGDQSQGRSRTSVECLDLYGQWFHTLATSGKSWQEYIMNQILKDENPFTLQIQRQSLKSLPPYLIAAVGHDLKILQSIYNFSPDQITEWVSIATQFAIEPISWNGEIMWEHPLKGHHPWSRGLEDLALYYQSHGVGDFGRFWGFTWNAKTQRLQGVAHLDPITLKELVGYEEQKQTLVNNTKALMEGKPALNILLYGARGTGKSSLVKALGNKFGSEGLRLIQLNPQQLQWLPQVLATIEEVPQKFIIFVDDLSFEEDDANFKALKVAVQGGLQQKSDNVVIYATSNRRHLVREFFDDRPRPQDLGEIHNRDTIEEKLSFSDRFGLTLTFTPTNKTLTWILCAI